MSLFHYANSIYGGSETLIGANYDLLPWFALAGLGFAIAHAVFKAVTVPSKSR